MKRRFLKAAANSHKYPAVPRENVRNEGMVVCWLRPGDDKEEEEVAQDWYWAWTDAGTACPERQSGWEGTSVSSTHSQKSTSQEPKYSVA